MPVVDREGSRVRKGVFLISPIHERVCVTVSSLDVRGEVDGRVYLCDSESYPTRRTPGSRTDSVVLPQDTTFSPRVPKTRFGDDSFRRPL